MANVSDREDDDIKHYENQEFGEHDNYEEIDEAASDNEARIAQRIDLSKTKTHIIRNPVLKLNTERLKGSKGIQTIEKYFEGFKFYGKGHERMDLDRIMKRLEHWSYRLFPKYHFDDFLMKVEQLGMKKDLQVFIKKYRLDMITFDNSLVMHDNMDEDKEDQQENMPLDDLDLLIMEQIQKQKQAETRASVTTVSTSYEDAFDELLMQSTDIQNSQIQHTNITTVTATAANAIAANATIIATTTTNELSSEMKQKIERNKQLAIQRRFQRQKECEEPKRLKFTDNANKQKLNESVNLTIDNKIDESHSDR